MGLIWFLLIGLLAGWLAGKLMSGGGFIADLLVATFGAVGVLALVQVLKRA